MLRTSPSWTRSLTPSAWLRSFERVRPHGVARRAHRRQDVGQVQLALRVVGAQRVERVEQGAGVEREDRAVDLADLELLLRRVAGRLRLDDPLDVAVVVAHDAAVAGRVVERHRRHRGGGARAVVLRDERRDRRAGDERHVARQHDDGALRIDVRGGGLDGAAGAVGFELDDAGDGVAGRKPAFEGVRVRVDDDDSVGAGVERGGDRPADERAPAQRVQHLRKLERIRVPWPAARITAVKGGIERTIGQAPAVGVESGACGSARHAGRGCPTRSCRTVRGRAAGGNTGTYVPMWPALRTGEPGFEPG